MSRVHIKKILALKPKAHFSVRTRLHLYRIHDLGLKAFWWYFRFPCIGLGLIDTFWFFPTGIFWITVSGFGLVQNDCWYGCNPELVTKHMALLRVTERNQNKRNVLHDDLYHNASAMVSLFFLSSSLLSLSCPQGNRTTLKTRLNIVKKATNIIKSGCQNWIPRIANIVFSL